MAAALEQVRAVAGEGGPIVTIDLRLGATGFVADLAILDDEFIGVVILDAATDLSDLSRRLEDTSRYFERVVLVAAPDHLPGLDPASLSGATVWTYDRVGRLAEHDPGTGNRVGLNARFDLLRLDERRYFLGELVTVDGVEPRGPVAVPATRTRALFGMVFTARYGQASTVFGRRSPIARSRRTISSRSAAGPSRDRRASASASASGRRADLLEWRENAVLQASRFIRIRLRSFTPLAPRLFTTDDPLGRNRNNLTVARYGIAERA